MNGGPNVSTLRQMSARSPSVTLRDVARDSGVSITTVSRIVNGRETGVPIRDETRSRVLSIAASLGYKPNLLARGLRGSRSSLLGVIARDISDPFHLQVLRGINAAATERDYRVFLGHVDYRPDVALTYGSMFERSHADGVLMIGDIDGGELSLDAYADQHRNVVGVTDRTSRRHFPGVYSDDVIGTRLALDHLWALGHRRIICVSNDRTADGSLRIRLYKEFMRANGLGDLIDVHLTDQNVASSLEEGRRIVSAFERGVRPTAIYATSDQIAIGLLQAAYQSGIPVPGQLSIVGFDDIDFASFAIPPLTTVSQSGVRMGRIAAEMLLDMIEQERDRDEVDDVVLEPHLVVRQSTASPPG